MQDVVYLDGDDQEDGLTANSVLEGALESGLSDVLLVGVDDEGGWYYATSDPDITHIVFAIERFKQFIMQFERGRIVG